MKPALGLIAICVSLAACGQRGESLPFYLTHVEEMRKLPEEDLLRMKDNILAESARLPDRPVNDVAAGDAEVVASGILQAAPGHGEAAGTAEIQLQPDGSLTLALRDFRVANAPDSQIVMAGDVDVFQRPLRGNAGTQVESLQVGTYRSVKIRSVLFDETIASAELSPR